MVEQSKGVGSLAAMFEQNIKKEENVPLKPAPKKLNNNFLQNQAA